ncbi:MAG: SUMF1/EgtB/PvdO family nonheme iron enzyme, partial [Candidatus Brocadiia bacterium]
MDDTSGQQMLGRFELLETLAEGPAGRLYRARDTESDRPVLLKVISSVLSQSPAFGRYFYDKWADHQSLAEHPNLLEVWEAGREGETHFVAAETVPGDTMSQLLKRAPLEHEEALDVVHQLAEAIRAIHRRNVHHGQLKPSDVFLSEDRLGRPLVKLSLFDLGVSAADGFTTGVGDRVGAPKYMAPEVIQGGTPGPQADIFALGVVAYELFTGREPFPSEHAVGYLFSNCQKALVPANESNEAVPHEIAQVLQRMLEKEPSSRYRTIQRVVDDLDRCRQSITTGRVEHVPYGTDSAFARDYQLAEPEPEAEQSPAGIRAGHLVVAVLLVAAIVAVAGYYIGRGDQFGGSGPADTERPGGTSPAQMQAAEPPQPRPSVPPAIAPGSPEWDAQRALSRAEEDWQRYGGRGQYELGVAAFNEVADRFPATPQAEQARERMGHVYLEWADTLADQDKYEEALEKYQKAIKAVPEDSRFAGIARSKIPGVMAGAAENARRRGDYSEALRIYREIARRYPGTMEAELLAGKEPELLVNQASVLKSTGLHAKAREMLLGVIRDYPDTSWAESARAALPDIYLQEAARDIAAGRVQNAQKRVQQLIEAYPEHGAARKARKLDAEIIHRQFVAARANEDEDAASARFSELLSRYPDTPAAVEAIRDRLELGQEGAEPSASRAAADNMLRKAREHRKRREFADALGLLQKIIGTAPAELPAAVQAAQLLPQWSYRSALHALGSDSPEQCETALLALSEDFVGSPWASRAERTLKRLKDPPAGMVYVPEGSFQMGTDLKDVEQLLQVNNLLPLGGGRSEVELLAETYGFSAELPLHQAETGAFFIDRTEVTNLDYARFLAETGHPPPSTWPSKQCPPGKEKLPVVGISLSDARAYADWRRARLPTEAEWEKAARGVDGRVYPWGNRFSEKQCRHMQPERAGPVAVGSHEAWDSPYGCLDMIGNAMEWTTGEFEPYADNPLEMPAASEQAVVRRGGSWRQEELAPIPTRCASRYPAHPAEADRYTGFRCVVTASEEPLPGAETAQ